MSIFNTNFLDPAEASLGVEKGALNSTSERIQIIIIIFSVIVWGTLVFLGVVDISLFVPGMVGTIVVIHFWSKKYAPFHTEVRIYEFGVKVSCGKHKIIFLFCDVVSISAKRSHHYTGNNYVGSKLRMELKIDGRLSPYRCECEFGRGGKEERLIDFLLEQCVEAAQQCLQKKLEHDGKVPWTKDVYMTPDSIVLTHPNNIHSRIVPTHPIIIRLKDIEELKVISNQLKIWKRNDAMPILVLSTDLPNIMPLFALLKKLIFWKSELTERA